jgi:hypothetical protein
MIEILIMIGMNRWRFRRVCDHFNWVSKMTCLSISWCLAINLLILKFKGYSIVTNNLSRNRS